MNDRDFSVTLNGFFLVRWRDPRLIIENVEFGENEPLIPVDVSLVRKIKEIVQIFLFEPFISCQCQLEFAMFFTAQLNTNIVFLHFP